eukprot:TRINITY_DN9611_c0_g1_i2.p1 TRINITY_DN9611_c0_g1~~TRINITY_DN9611_c0_g1_i2.p1  ORF type:complete len:285 (+),score=45.67 TRINITY_DN9611_c0_g1_i2:98-952(+)
MPPISPYKVLGVANLSAKAVVRAAYLRLVRETHPDVNGGCDKRFKDIQNAYERISSGKERNERDRQRTTAETTTSKQWQNWQMRRPGDVNINDLPEPTYLYRHMCQYKQPDTPSKLKPGMWMYATPGAGPKFKDCVVLITTCHDTGGVIGYILNKKISKTKKQTLEDSEIGRQTTLDGGPCGHRGHKVLVHRDAKFAAQYKSPHVQSANSIFFDPDVTFIKMGRFSPPVIMSGYCGWPPGVLDRAIQRGAWKVIVGGNKILQETHPDDLFRVARCQPTYCVGTL